MNKYLRKLKSGTYKIRGEKMLNCNYYIQNMSCGNGYKEGLKHLFYSDDETDISLLIKIIKKFRFKTKITNVRKNSFEFESEFETQQIFFFRICRYVRYKNIKKILEDTLIMNKEGVKIQNAFLLSHYYNSKEYDFNNLQTIIPYYNISMDGFYDPSGYSPKIYLNKPYKTLKSFKNIFGEYHMKTNGLYNNIFDYKTSSNFKKEKKIIFNFLKAKDFKAAEKYLLHVFK